VLWRTTRNSKAFLSVETKGKAARRKRQKSLIGGKNVARSRRNVVRNGSLKVTRRENLAGSATKVERGGKERQLITGRGEGPNERREDHSLMGTEKKSRGREMAKENQLRSLSGVD